MRSKLPLTLAALTATGILALIWLQLGERDAPMEPSGDREPATRVQAEEVESERAPDAGAELESDAALADPRSEAEAQVELPPVIESDRPRSTRWSDYLEVEFSWRESRNHVLPGYLRPRGVVVYVEGVEEPHPLLDMGKRVRRDTNGFTLTDYYKDEGWRISRVLVDDPRYRPVDLTLDPPLAKVEVELRGSSELEIEAVDIETREPLSGWSAVAYSSSCTTGGSAQLRRHPERRGGWAPVVAADYWVEVRHPEYALGGVLVTAPPGGSGHAVAEMSKVAKVRGRVVFEDFTPAAGARVRVAIPGATGKELPLFGDSFIFGESNSIEPYYRWLATTESAADGTFELGVSASAPLVVEATAGEILPQRVTVDGVAGQPISGVEIVLPRGLQLTGRVLGPALEPGRGYMIRATGPNGAGEMSSLQWEREIGDSFVAAWVDSTGAFELGPFPTDGGVQINVLDAPETVDIFGWLEDTGTRVLHTRVVKPVDGALEPVEIQLD
jgi:hypothetical protein